MHHASSFVLHGGGGGGSHSARAPHASEHTFTTLPPIFAARPAQAHSHSARVSGARSARAGTAAGNSGATRIHAQRKAPLPQLKRPRDSSDAVGNGRASTAGGAPPVFFASGSGPRRANANGSTTQMGGIKTMPRHHGHDEATIGPDGLVTFGPNLSLMMSSLAVRFDDHPSGAGGTGENDEASGPGGAAGSNALVAVGKRKRAARKALEMSAMSELYSKALEEKQAAAAAGGGGQQQQWFQARFSYPLVHQPAPPRSRQAVPGDARSAHVEWSPAAPAAAAPAPAAAPSAHHAHLLHSASSGDSSRSRAHARVTVHDELAEADESELQAQAEEDDAVEAPA